MASKKYSTARVPFEEFAANLGMVRTYLSFFWLESNLLLLGFWGERHLGRRDTAAPLEDTKFN